VLVDNLLDAGYRNLTFLICPNLPGREPQRLGERAGRVTWRLTRLRERILPAGATMSDDRAVFHFLTDRPTAARYVEQVLKSVEARRARDRRPRSPRGPLSVRT